MRRRLLAVLVAGALLTGAAWSATAVGAGSNGRGAFTDDDGSVHEANINGLAAAGVTKGCNPPANTHFCPDSPITRAEMATFLTRALNLPPAQQNTFTDTASSIHAANIAAIAQAGITKGCNPPQNTRYCPDRPVSRAEMATFLTRALNLPPAQQNTFTDTASSIHAANIAAIAQAGITKGCNPPQNTRYCPDRPVSRAEMATFLTRAMPSIQPILNRLSVLSGPKCSKDGTSCTGRLTLVAGVQMEAMEGWYQVVPYQSGEEAAFKSGSTVVSFTWDGSPLSRTYLGLNEKSSPATRRSRVAIPTLTSGSHTFRAAWRWNGTTTQTVTWVITVP